VNLLAFLLFNVDCLWVGPVDRLSLTMGMILSGSDSRDAPDQAAWLSLLRRQRLIAVIRTDDPAMGVQMAQAVAAGGIQLIEITWNSRQPATLLRQIRAALPACWVGVGTVLSEADLKDAIATGAQFCFSPHTSIAMIQLAHRLGIPMMPGAMTPTEIVAAWQAGATAVKLFPISSLGGAAYLRSLQGPLSQIPLIPTGGVTLATAPELLAAGAIAVGLSSSLYHQPDLANQNWNNITRRAQQLVRQCPPLN
jgi:2-dehydro-3-deoxyphosphogluconate aldolase/(4S)-4-hydroxy-2-oxoglutarate aldolase